MTEQERFLETQVSMLRAKVQVLEMAIKGGDEVLGKLADRVERLEKDLYLTDLEPDRMNLEKAVRIVISDLRERVERLETASQ